MYAVYRVFDAVEDCLYVGCSDKPWERMRRHELDAKLTTNVRSIDLTWVESHREALALERREIRRLRPKFNVRSLHPYNRRKRGTLAEAVWRALVDATEPVTSLDICRAIGTSTPTNISTVLGRLKKDGYIEIVGGIKVPGRVAYLYQMTELGKAQPVRPISTRRVEVAA